MARTTFRLRVWTRYFTPPGVVWAQKTDPAMLRAEFAPWLHFQMTPAAAAALQAAVQAGHPLETQARLIPPGLSWPIRLVRSEPGRLFEDHSDNMLFTRFEHRHELEETRDGCRYVDDVVFQPRVPASKLAAILTQRLFVHRHRVAARTLPADAQTVGTSVLRVLVEELEGFGGEAEG